MRKVWANQRLMALADQLVVSASNFLTSLLVARLLAMDGFGQYSLALMGTLFVANMQRAVFTQPMNILGAAETPAQLAARVCSMLQAHLYVVPLVALFIAILSYYLFPSVGMCIAVVWYLAGFLMQELPRRYWYSRMQIDRAFVNDLLSYGGQVLLVFIVHWGWGLTRVNVFVVMGATSWLAFLVGLRMVDRPRPRAAVPPVREMFAQHWGIARWLVLTVLAVWGAGQVYPFLIASLGPVAVAIFSAARNILNVVGILVQSYSNYLPTRAARLLQERGKRALRGHMVATIAQTGVAALGLFFAMQWLAQPLLHFLYGGNYDHAEQILKILAVGAACTVMGAALGAYSLAMEDSRSNFLANLGASAITFSLGFWLIREHGLVGAAIATSLSLATAASLQAIFVIARYRRLPENMCES